MGEMMKRFDTPAGSRWFSDPDYAATWCRQCGYDPRDLVDDKNLPELELVHGSVYKKRDN